MTRAKIMQWLATEHQGKTLDSATIYNMVQDRYSRAPSIISLTQMLRCDRLHRFRMLGKTIKTGYDGSTYPITVFEICG